jgi:hypothetical protein
VVLVIGGGVYVYENNKAKAPVVVDAGLQQIVMKIIHAT